MAVLDSTILAADVRMQLVKERVTALIATLALHDAPSEQALVNVQPGSPSATQGNSSIPTNKYNIPDLSKAPWALGGTGLLRIQLNKLG